ncbi:MBL fold metallo-hydrolase [Rhizobium sp. S95]|uniref:MBL fold metallo-hydrolase n=1 Tax=Ciceribacter sichuanensis TaxID=2949647 RepID=A0AAJ1FA70_9HYPH|nr:MULTISPECIES: MBL fold metallo-hydrolase [unclassified Ciceribacter]MCM2397796.1 MBL fold metallo-hydrolase [Ciceribacter sp. S95]MCO5960124.1 MBL fold metallo-hydrolase [Ciceribacter sp. S101]
MTQSEFHSFRHGEFDITVLSDGPIVLNGELFAPEANEDERADIVSRLKGQDNSAHAQSNIPLIVYNEQVILVDVGAGRRFQPTEGMLEENLERVGVRAEDVTIVLISHAHPDHIWGLLRDDGSLRFPKAKYFVGKAEWEFWMGEAASALPAEVQPFVEGARRDLSAVQDCVNLIEDGAEIVPGMHVLATPGHTPGHLSAVIEGDIPLIITVDAASSEIVSFEHPDWSFGFDMDPARAKMTRRTLLDRAAAQDAKLLGFHWSYPGVGRIKKAGAAYDFISAAGEKS